MAQDKDQIKSSYPLPAYNYRVTVLRDGEALVLSFAEVSGLSLQYDPVTYKHGLSFALGVKDHPRHAPAHPADDEARHREKRHVLIQVV